VRTRALVAVSAVACGLATAGYAAVPKPNGLYSGTVTANHYLLKVELHVSPNGKTASARFYCNGTTLATSPQDNARFAITNGAFSGLTQYGIYGIKGTFTSGSKASATMHVQGTCSTSSSANYKLTLTLH